MTPTASAAMATRPSSSVARKLAKPRPRSPSRLASGTRHPVEGEAVGVRRMPAHLAVGGLDLEARRPRRHDDREISARAGAGR